MSLEQLVVTMEGEVPQVRSAAAQAEQRATEAPVLGVRSEGVVDTRSLGKPRSFDDATDNWRQSKFTFLGYDGAVDARPKQDGRERGAAGISTHGFSLGSQRPTGLNVAALHVGTTLGWICATLAGTRKGW